MAVTDDERREVAGRLFELSGRRDTQGFDCLLAEAVRGYEFCETPCDECHRRLAAELAGLIEPTPNRSEDTPKCDRDALLALSDELEENAELIIRAARNARFTGCWVTMEEAKHDAGEWRYIARRIRKALGAKK